MWEPFHRWFGLIVGRRRYICGLHQNFLPMGKRRGTGAPDVFPSCSEPPCPKAGYVRTWPTVQAMGVVCAHPRWPIILSPFASLRVDYPKDPHCLRPHEYKRSGGFTYNTKESVGHRFNRLVTIRTTGLNT